MTDKEETAEMIRERFDALLGAEIANQHDFVSTEQCHVIVIEDDTIDRRAAAKAVLESGVATILQEASSIEEARRILEKSRPTIALMDYRLPDGTGLEFLPELTAQGTDVVIITGAGSEHIAVSALQEGAADYIVKDTMGTYLRLLPATLKKVLEARLLRHERSELITRLSRALELLATFEHFVTICACCKKIRQGEQWYNIENFIKDKVDTDFSHGYCPDCYTREMEKLNDS